MNRYLYLTPQLPLQNLITARSDTHSEFHENIYNRVLLVAHFVFFCSFIATPVPPPPLRSTYLTSLPNMF